MPGHAGLFEARLLRWSSTSSQNIPWSIIDELGNSLASCTRVVEGNKAATLVHKEETSTHAEHMANTCTHTLNHRNTKAASYLSTSLQRSEQQYRLPPQDPPHDEMGGNRKWHFFHHALFKAENLQLLKHNHGLWKEVHVRACVSASSPPTQALKLQMWSSRTIIAAKDGRRLRLWSPRGRLPQIAASSKPKFHHEKTVCDRS